VHSATAFATPRYSASALDLETVLCRFDDHETSESPRNTQNPDVERRVSGHPAQSASVYPQVARRRGAEEDVSSRVVGVEEKHENQGRTTRIEEGRDSYGSMAG
jgi:hypothetical protein